MSARFPSSEVENAKTQSGKDRGVNGDVKATAPSVRFAPVADWTFLTNHAHVMVCLRRDPGARIRDVAQAVGITERAAQRIVTELEDAGYLTRVREGRRNRYTLHERRPLRHPLEGTSSIADLLDAVAEPPVRS
jgi:DNA-binding transcriptional ArsR family regulator